ncbi:MAG: hypothetical protein AB7F86_05645 [Bdellovibrionales bacterium]
MKGVIFALGLIFSTGTLAHGGGHGPGVSHLTFANGAIHAHASWIVGPQGPQESLLRIEWKNGADHSATVPPGPFEVVLWMPSMGHGSAPTSVLELVDAKGQPILGSYDVKNIFFLMSGHWDVNVTLTFQDRTKETKTIKVEL